ncbi:nitroreductase family protein [Blastomonas sp. CACIA14H2]|uniref:nitroreductase family protein n=1 Tax=Blastomonas sp. CACIA14H2 TaxID=1419876 RepID=UPI0003FEF86D
MSEIMSFHEVVRRRHSIRNFLPDPVPESIVRAVLSEAQMAPSNCNTQPWQVHIATGAKRDELAAAIIAGDESGNASPDFSFDTGDYTGVYFQRAMEQGASYYRSIGVSREAMEDRRMAARLNYSFFHAPCVAMLFMPSVGDNVRIASDIGMYAQTFLLSLTAHGLGGIPQTALGFYAGTIRKVLGIDDSLKMLFGISFGYPDEHAAGHSYRIGKAAIEESVTFHS